MRQTADVLKIEGKNTATVRVQRKSACASARACDTCDGCSLMTSAPEITVSAKFDGFLKVGDTVLVESQSASVLKFAFILYILPLVLFFFGYFIAAFLHVTEAVCVLTGGFGFLVGFCIALLTDRYIKRCNQIQYKIISVL